MRTKDIKNKLDLIQFIKEQVNVELVNDAKDRLNNKRNILYTQISGNAVYSIFPLLYKYKIKFVKHHIDNYWIYVKQGA